MVERALGLRLKMVPCSNPRTFQRANAFSNDATARACARNVHVPLMKMRAAARGARGAQSTKVRQAIHAGGIVVVGGFAYNSYTIRASGSVVFCCSVRQYLQRTQ